MKAFWITFYSYKGGVGRSLALANIAALLVQRGRRVVLIDFDLEAPGLDSFEEFKPLAGRPGVVEYVNQFENNKTAPEIGQFLHHCELPGHLRGKLWIMPAGRKDAEYNTNRANLNWSRLYDSGLGEPFVENWKAAIARHCQPDYVLVDSRTGLTDVGGICTLHLPDLVVLFFGLNEQNVRGVAAVAKTIRESEFTRIPQLHYVASPVPNIPKDKNGVLVKRWVTATTAIGAKVESVIHYNPLAALNERLFVLDETLESSSLVRDYEELLNRLITYNRNGLDFLWNQSVEAIGTIDTPLIQRLLAVFQQEYPDRAEGLMIQSRLNHALGQIDEAKTLAIKALSADPTYDDPFDWLVDHYRREKDYAAALALCNSILQQTKQLPPDQLAELHVQRGEIAMTAGDYEAASESAEFCLDLEHGKESAPMVLLVRKFNYAEAIRRRDKKVYPDEWKHVIGLFKKSGETSDATLTIQANRWQAIHIAFALIGDTTRAREALMKARHAAELLGLAEDIFTVKNYTNLPVDGFIQITDEMLAALDRGHLWDGMPLPQSAS